MPFKNIKNKAFIDIELCDETHTLETNEVSSKIVDIKVSKTQSCNYIFKGDTIKYCVKIENESDFDLKNLKFRDTLENRISFVPGSFTVNNITKIPTVNGKTISYNIDEIKENQTMIICFKVKAN